MSIVAACVKIRENARTGDNISTRRLALVDANVEEGLEELALIMAEILIHRHVVVIENQELDPLLKV